MALLFCDSFDHYTSAEIAQKWSAAVNSNSGSPTIQTTTVRNGTQAAQIATNGNNCSTMQKNLSNSASLFVGFACYPSTPSTTSALCQFGDSGTTQITVSLTTTGQIAVYRGNSNTLLGSSSSSISFSAWNYIEIGVTFATGTTGSVTVKVNGVSFVALTSVQTSNSANAYANAFALGILSNIGGGTYGVPAYIDDLYICDGTGTTHNTFLGDIKVACLLPTANGRINQWTINGGTTNYGCVDTSPAATTNYVSDATVGNIDDYALSAYPGGTPLAVQVVAYAEKDDSGTRTLGLGVGNGTTEAFDAGHPLTQNSYQFFTSPLDTNPLTSAAWASGDFTTLQASIKEIA